MADKALFLVGDVVQRTGLSEATVRHLIARELIPSRRLGRRIVGGVAPRRAYRPAPRPAAGGRVRRPARSPKPSAVAAGRVSSRHPAADPLLEGRRPAPRSAHPVGTPPMPEPTRAPSDRLQGVATPAPSPVDSSAGCLHCGRPIPRPRPRQKACSSGCRWSLWKAGRQRAARAQTERDRNIRELLEAALKRLEDSSGP
jgi:predicted nucleic acid-binding Zn ribbon protein